MNLDVVSLLYRAWQEESRNQLRLLLSKGPRGVRNPDGILALKHVQLKGFRPFWLPTEDEA